MVKIKKKIALALSSILALGSGYVFGGMTRDSEGSLLDLSVQKDNLFGFTAHADDTMVGDDGCGADGAGSDGAGSDGAGSDGSDACCGDDGSGSGAGGDACP